MRVPRSKLAAAACASALLALPTLAAPRADAQGTGGGSAESQRLRVLEQSARDFAVAVAAHRRGDLDAAVEAYRLALAKDASFVESAVNLARVRAEQGRPDDAERWLDRAERMRDDYPGTYKVRALLAMRRGQPARAVESLTRALALQPGDAEALTNLGAALLETGRTAEATEVLAQALRANPNRAGTVFNLGLALDRARDFSRARYHYRRYLALVAAGDPTRRAVRARLAELDGRPDPAVGAEPPEASARAIPQRPNPEGMRNARDD